MTFTPKHRLPPADEYDAKCIPDTPLSARDRLAATAWAKGMAGGPAAIRWLARAARLAPGEPRLKADLARLRLDGNRNDLLMAEASFAALALQYDHASTWLGLAMARDRLSDQAGAAAAICALLKRHCIPDDPQFHSFATHIAQQARFCGFIGISIKSDCHESNHTVNLLNPEPDLAAINMIKGIVALDDTGMHGWASRPAADHAPPRLELRDGAGKRRRLTFGPALEPDEHAPFLRRYPFNVPHNRLRSLTPPLSLRGPDGMDLPGSPIFPNILSIPWRAAAYRGSQVRTVPPRQPLAVIIPVYRGFVAAQACITSLRMALPGHAKIIVVDDATPEVDLASWLESEAVDGRLVLHRHEKNLGFSAAVNTGLEAAGTRDVLLLNSDTLVPPGAITTMRRLAYAKANTGSVTPFSNSGSIISYPIRHGSNLAPDLAETTRLNMLARKANGTRGVEIPTGVGFCMYIRHDCLAATGGFRSEIFAQGYGEENDWCIRARHLGFTHQAALGAYVTHLGGLSFGSSAYDLMTRNLTLLNRLFPGYQKLISDYIHDDPLATARFRIDALRLRMAHPDNVMLLISHSHGGGVARQVKAQISALRAQGYHPLLLATKFPDNPEATPYPWPSLLSDGDAESYPNLSFTLPQDHARFLRCLRSLPIRKLILHHTLGHHPEIRRLSDRLNVPQEIVIHDYACFCPRVTLMSWRDDLARQVYCGEPDTHGCEACCKISRRDLHEDLPIRQLLKRSRREFNAATRICAPSADTALRISRHFHGIHPVVIPWEDDRPAASLKPPGNTQHRTIVVIGGIGPSKGFDVLAACARDAATRLLTLDFLVVGTTADDQTLLDTGRIFITGPYTEPELQPLIAGFKPDLAFLPSIWPETWCFTLSEAWRAGLYSVVFDLGAQAERVKATGRGVILPLGLPPNRINDVLLNWQPIMPS